MSKQAAIKKKRKAKTAQTSARGVSCRIITLHTDSRFFLAVFGIALTSCQAAFQLLRHAFITVLAHWPQVNFNKLISELPHQVKHVRGETGRENRRKSCSRRVKYTKTSFKTNTEVGVSVTERQQSAGSIAHN